MDINGVDDVLGILWSSTIEDFRVDLAQHEIALQTRYGENKNDVRWL